MLLDCVCVLWKALKIDVVGRYWFQPSLSPGFVTHAFLSYTIFNLKLKRVGCPQPQSCPPAWEQDEMLMNQ